MPKNKFFLRAQKAQNIANALQKLVKHGNCKELRRHFGQFNKNLKMTFWDNMGQYIGQIPGAEKPTTTNMHQQYFVVFVAHVMTFANGSKKFCNTINTEEAKPIYV